MAKSTAVEVPAMKEDKIGGRSRWEVESDLRAIRDVGKIKADKSRLGAVRILVKEEMGALEKIANSDKGFK